MKKKLWKSVALLLTLVMIFGTLSACSSKESDDTSEAKTTGMETTAETSETAGEVKEVELTLAMNYQAQTDPIPWNETDVWKVFFDYVEENYGYRLKVDWVYYDTDKFNLMLVSGELDDIIFTNGQETANTLISSGYALDLNTVADKLPNIMSDTFAQRNQVITELTGGDESALYFVPSQTGVEYVDGGTTQPRGYSVRWDWYKEIGCPEINSDEDYINVLAQMVANHHTTETGEKVYAYGIPSDLFNYWYQRAAFAKPSFLNYWTYDGYLYMDGLDDNVLYNGYTNLERSAYWQDMTFMYELNKLGLFDMDSFTQNVDEFKAKVTSQRYASTYMPMGELYNATAADKPDTLAGYTVVPSSNALVFADKCHLAGYFPDKYTCISTKSDNVDAALAFVDALHNLDIQRMLSCGIEGTHWDYDTNGVPTMSQETIDMLKENGDAAKTSGIGIIPLKFSQNSTLCEDGYQIYLRDSEELRSQNLTILNQDISNYYGVSYPSQAFMKLVDAGVTIDHKTNYSQTVAIAREEMPADIARILTKCNDIYYNAMPELIMAKDDAEFAAIQAEIIEKVGSVGEATAWEWCSKTHQSARDIIKPIYEVYLNNYISNNK